MRRPGWRRPVFLTAGFAETTRPVWSALTAMAGAAARARAAPGATSMAASRTALRWPTGRFMSVSNFPAGRRAQARQRWLPYPGRNYEPAAGSASWDAEILETG